MESPLFVPPGHFYSPVVNTHEASAYLDRLEAAPWPKEMKGLTLDHEKIKANWIELSQFFASFPFTPTSRDDGKYLYQSNNNAFPYSDALLLYSYLRKFQPKRIIEVGSGWSSACAVETIKMHFKHECEMTFIEPYPALLKDLIGDYSEKVKIREEFVQATPLETFDALEENDILFIDSTHVVKTGSDCCTEFFDILPRLKKGVVIHVHDIFWPFEYPRHWVVGENRSWNEIYLLRALLTNNPQYEFLGFTDYMTKVLPDLVSETAPDFLGRSGGSLWLRKI